MSLGWSESLHKSLRHSQSEAVAMAVDLQWGWWSAIAAAADAGMEFGKREAMLPKTEEGSKRENASEKSSSQVCPRLLLPLLLMLVLK